MRAFSAPKCALAATIACAAVLSCSSAIAWAAPTPVPGTDKTYTLDAEFDSGELDNVNHDAPNNDQLQLDRESAFFPFVNIAASARGTIIRIDVNTGQIVAEWFSAPTGRPRNPSRTTVDRLGNVWFSNRNEDTGGRGSVGRYGVVVGGSRVNSDGSANPAGAFLAPPYAYNTCQDRNGDGLLFTSRGLGDIRPWTNAGGVDTDGGVDTAADECLITFTRVAGNNTRTVAVDANNDLWTGGSDTQHEKVDGATGAVVPGTLFSHICGGYGGLIDGKNVLWSARYGNNLLRRDLNTATGACFGTDRGDYGLGLDPNTGEIWHTTIFGPSTGNPATSGRVCKLNPANAAVIGCFAHGSANAQGVAVDGKGNVWVAHSLFNATTVGHLRTDGTFVGNVTLPGGDGPTGVAVDSNGKVWVANINSDNAMRIDPNAGPVGGGGFHVGAVDMTVNLGPGAGPYNYSDMTGAVLGEITAPIGTWTVRQDGGIDGTDWTSVTWNTEPEGSVPAGTDLDLEGRAADTEAGLDSAPYVPLPNGGPTGLFGRYIEVRATLKAAPNGDSPILSDVRIVGDAPTVSVGDASVIEGDTATVEVSLDRPAHVDVTGMYETSDGSAVQPADYPQAMGGWVIPAGSMSTTIDLATTEDAIDEPAEVFHVTISEISGAKPGDTKGDVTIVDDDRNGAFACRASALRAPIVGEPIVSNGPYRPCRDGDRTAVDVRSANVPILGVFVKGDVLRATTDQQPDDLASAPPAPTDNASARASAARVNVTVPGVTLSATALTSSALAQCSKAETVETSGQASTASLVVNGRPVAVNGPLTVPLGVGTLYVNRVTSSGGHVTAQALFLDLPGTALDVVVAESRAGADGNPCAV